MSKTLSLSDELMHKLEQRISQLGISKQELIEENISAVERLGQENISLRERVAELEQTPAMPRWWEADNAMAQEHMRRLAEMHSLPDGTRVVYPNGNVWVVKRGGGC